MIWIASLRGTALAVLVLTTLAPQRAVGIDWVAGDGEWHVPANWNPAAVPTILDDVTIPGGRTVTISSGAQNVRRLISGGRLDVTSGSLTVHQDGGTITSVVMPAGFFPTLASADGGVLTITGPSDFSSGILRAQSGGDLLLPGTTAFFATSAGSTFAAQDPGSLLDMSAITQFSGGTFNRTNVLADAGALLRLSSVAAITDGATFIRAQGTSSFVQLNALTNFSRTNFSDFAGLRAENGGVIVTPNLTRLGPVSVEVIGTGSSVDVNDVNQVDRTSFFAQNDGRITLPSLASYVGGSDIGTTLQADGAGSALRFPALTSFSGGGFNRTNVHAFNSSLVEMPLVTSIAAGATSVYARDPGSLIDLPLLTTFSRTNFADVARLRAENGGRIRTPNLTTLGPVNVELSGQLSSLQIGQVTSVDRTSFYASNGGILLPQGVTTYAGGGDIGTTLQSEGVGSLLRFANLATFSGGLFNRTNINAFAGGLVEIPAVSNITVGATRVFARDAGSIVELPLLTTFSRTNFADAGVLRAESGGAIRTPNLTTFTNVIAEIVGPGSTIDLNDVTNADGSSFYTEAGGQLILPALTTYNGGNGPLTVFQASGAGSVVRAPALATIHAGSFPSTRFNALDGGRVEFAGLTKIPSGAVSIVADGAGSVIDMSNLTDIVVTSSVKSSGMSASNGGSLNLNNSGTTQISGAPGAAPLTITVTPTGAINARHLQLGANALLFGNGTLPAPLTNSAGHISPGNRAVHQGVVGELQIQGDFTQDVTGTLHVDLGGLVPGTQHDRLNVTGVAHLDGALEIAFANGYAPQAGHSFQIMTYASFTGGFDRLIVPPSTCFQIQYHPTNVVLTIADLLGDLDHDGDVDRADAATLTQNYGRTGAGLAPFGDLDTDGDIDVRDIHLLQTHLCVGGIVSPAPVTAVPEPAAWLLVMLTGGGVWLGRRGTKR